MVDFENLSWGEESSIERFEADILRTAWDLEETRWGLSQSNESIEIWSKIKKFVKCWGTKKINGRKK